MLRSYAYEGWKYSSRNTVLFVARVSPPRYLELAMGGKIKSQGFKILSLVSILSVIRGLSMLPDIIRFYPISRDVARTLPAIIRRSTRYG